MINEALRTLSSIVDEYIIERGESGNSKKFRYIALAKNGIRDLNFDVSGVPKIERLCADENNHSVYYLPSDLIKLKTVFFPSSGGISELVRDDKMNPVVDECYEETSTGNNTKYTGAVGAPWSLNSAKYRNGRYMGGVFGLGGGSVNRYYLNEREGRIEVAPHLAGRSDLFIEYLGSEEKFNGKTLVHPFLIQPLKYWIYWTDIRFKKSVGRNEKMLAQRDYYRAKHHADVQFKSDNIKQFINAKRQTQKQSPKY